MKINYVNVSVDDAIKYANCDNYLMKHRDNNMLLSDYQITILKQNGIDFMKYTDLKQLLFEIDEVLDIEYDEELDNVASQLSELSYYKDTKK